MKMKRTISASPLLIEYARKLQNKVDYLVNLVQRTAGDAGNFLFDSQLGFRALAAEFESKAKPWKNC